MLSCVVQIFIDVRGSFCLQQDEYTHTQEKTKKERHILVLLEVVISSSLLFVNI